MRSVCVLAMAVVLVGCAVGCNGPKSVRPGQDVEQVIPATKIPSMPANPPAKAQPNEAVDEGLLKLMAPLTPEEMAENERKALQREENLRAQTATSAAPAYWSGASGSVDTSKLHAQAEAQHLRELSIQGQEMMAQAQAEQAEIAAGEEVIGTGPWHIKRKYWDGSPFVFSETHPAQRRFYRMVDDPSTTPGELGEAMLDAFDEIDAETW